MPLTTKANSQRIIVLKYLRRKTLGLAFAGLLGLVAIVAAQDQDAMKANYEAKLAKDFVKNATWITDYDKALNTAKAQNKPIFAYFSRSYAP